MTKSVYEMNGKEYELKLDYKAIKYLTKEIDGGTLGAVGLAMSGDLDAFPKIIHAALLHTGESFKFKDVEASIIEKVDGEELDLNTIMKIGNSVVADSFFLKATVAKLMKDPEAKAAMNQLLAD